MIGKIESIETMGLVDGPGVRFVVFMQGCPLRCKFCHNPETWNLSDEVSNYTTEELMDKILRYKPYFKNNGGVTFSGGEPLMQKEFLIEILKLCKENNIHTCLDTAGSVPGYEEVLKYTDLVMFDIKGVTENGYKDMTGGKFDIANNFLKYCQQINIPIWLRIVIVPKINDTEEYVNELIRYIKPLKNIEKIEFLPYHTLGVHKYKELKIDYPLKNVADMDQERCKKLEEMLKEGLRN